MKKLLFAALFLLFVGLALVPAQAEAQGLVPCGGDGQPACTFCHTFSLLKNILDIFLFPTVPIIAALLIAVGGFFLFTGAASPQNLNRGRTIIFAVVIGLLIIYGSWLFINLLLDSLGVTIWTGPGTWFEIDCPIPLSMSLDGPASVVEGSNATLVWTIFGGPATTCTATGDWGGAKSTTSDSETLSSLTPVGTKTYTLECEDPDGNTMSDSVHVVVTPPLPVVTLTSSAPTIFDGDPLALTWTVSNVTSCKTIGDWPIPGPIPAANGSESIPSVTPIGIKTYTLECTGPGGTTSDSVSVVVKTAIIVTFNFTGGEQTWTVPAGINSITVDARGAQGAMGGSSCISTNLQQKGGRVQATLTVTPLEVLSIWVGGRPLSCPGVAPCFLPLEGTTVGGFNGGGSGGTGISCIGRGGGGASDVRQGGSSVSDRVVVAAGGGGASGSVGGDGGGMSGGQGGQVPGGKGATQIAGGLGGLACMNGGADGADGSLAQGGNGGNSVGTNSGRGGGGGGGGGYYGGGGGGGTHDACGGSGAGGGGSSLVPPGGSTTPGFQSGPGQVIITY